MITKKQHENLIEKTTKFLNEFSGSFGYWDVWPYLFGPLLYQYLSSKLTRVINESEQFNGVQRFPFESLSDNEAESIKSKIIDEVGYYLSPSLLFNSIITNLDNNKDIATTLEEAFNSIEDSAVTSEAKRSLDNIFEDVDVKAPFLGTNVNRRNERLSSLLNFINELEIDMNAGVTFRDLTDIFIDYFSEVSGKYGHRYFTPRSLSTLLVLIGTSTKTGDQNVYDGAAGSGSLLLEVANLANKDKVKLYGQELKEPIYNLSRMNFLLHNLGFNEFDLSQGDTLVESKQNANAPFDLIISNLPFPSKLGDKINLEDSRYAPIEDLRGTNTNDAFILDALSNLSSKGTAVITCFLTESIGISKSLRKYLVDNNFIDTVIQLPTNLSEGINHPLYILVLKKNKKSNDILFIDGSNEYKRVENHNELTQENIDQIYKLYKNRGNIRGRTKLVDTETVKQNGYNLTPCRIRM